MDISQRLMQLRKQHHLSQNELAQKLNLTRQSISKWENGRGYPDLDNLILLSKIYQLTVDELLKVESIESANEYVVEKAITREDDPEKMVQADYVYLLLLVVLGCYHPFPGIFVQLYLLKSNYRGNPFYYTTQLTIISCVVIGLVRVTNRVIR